METGCGPKDGKSCSDHGDARDPMLVRTLECGFGSILPNKNELEGCSESPHCKTCCKVVK